MFPLSFPLLRRCRKKCKSVQKFLRKCLSFGFVMLQNTDFQKEKKGHRAVLQTNFFCDLASDLKKKVIMLQIRYFLQFLGLWQKTNAKIKRRFTLVKIKNTGINAVLHLGKCVQKYQKIFCTFLRLEETLLLHTFCITDLLQWGSYQIDLAAFSFYMQIVIFFRLKKTIQTTVTSRVHNFAQNCDIWL